MKKCEKCNSELTKIEYGYEGEKEVWVCIECQNKELENDPWNLETAIKNWEKEKKK